MKDTIILSAFPGCGKSYLFNHQKEMNLTVLDSDSSSFSWEEDKVTRNKDFPNNYILHIKDNIGKCDIICVSSHDIVRNALKENKLNYILVFPDISSKETYMKNYKERGNDDKFLKFIDENWNKFILDMYKETFPKKIVLFKDEYIKDIIGDIENAKRR